MQIRLRSFQRHGVQALLFCAQIALIAGAAHTRIGPAAWLCALGLAVVSVAGWMHALGTLRHISDTPLSRIISAAQGYVALRGRGRALEGLPLHSPLNGLPVLWYRLLVERRNGNDWRQEAEDESEACLLLDDGSGLCAIDPQWADIRPSHREVVTRGNQRFTQWSILEHEALFVLGDFRTLHGDNLTRSEREAVRDILAEWKRDRQSLLTRFDLNQDGAICEDEWELARTEAQREARRQRIEADQAASAHIVRKPRDRRPFILSTVKPWRLKLPLQLWCLWHVALFLTACAGVASLLNTGDVAFL